MDALFSTDWERTVSSQCQLVLFYKGLIIKLLLQVRNLLVVLSLLTVQYSVFML